jgi:flagellar motor switch protein FliN/FliY
VSPVSSMRGVVDAMFASAAAVLATLVDRTVNAGSTEEAKSESSIRVEADTVATMTSIPSAGVSFVVRYAKADLGTVVGIMLGTPTGGELDAMQLSIVSETVAQISSAMGERIAQSMGVSADGIHSDVVTDAGAFPAPPFDSYRSTLALGEDMKSLLTIDFDGMAKHKMDGPAPAPPAPAPAPRAAPPPATQAVAFTQMAPTPIRAAPHGHANLDLVHDIPLQISAVLGMTSLSLRDVVALQSGSVFELDKASTDPIDLYVNNILIARGEVVVVDDKYAVKINELNPHVEKV